MQLVTTEGESRRNAKRIDVAYPANSLMVLLNSTNIMIYERFQ